MDEKAASLKGQLYGNRITSVGSKPIARAPALSQSHFDLDCTSTKSPSPPEQYAHSLSSRTPGTPLPSEPLVSLSADSHTSLAAETEADASDYLTLTPNVMDGKDGRSYLEASSIAASPLDTSANVSPTAFANSIQDVGLIEYLSLISLFIIIP